MDGGSLMGWWSWCLVVLVKFHFSWSKAWSNIKVYWARFNYTWNSLN